MLIFFTNGGNEVPLTKKHVYNTAGHVMCVQ